MAIRQIKLTREKEADLVNWLEETTNDIEDKVTARTKRWRLWREQYEGVTTPKNFPWVGASNVHAPITAIMVDAIHANMMQRLYGFDRLWDIQAEHPKEIVAKDTDTFQDLTWADMAKNAQEYLRWESSDFGPGKIYDIVENGTLECIKLGTTVWYAPWVTQVRKNYAVDTETGNIVAGEPITDFDGILPQVIPLEDFLIVPFYSEIHGPHASPLVGHKELLRPGQIAQLISDGKWRSTVMGGESTKDRVIHSGVGVGSDPSDEMRDHQAQLEGEWGTVASERGDDLRIYKLWLEIDINGDDKEESVYVEYHKDTQTIGRIQPYLYLNGRRPYEAARYVRREHRFYGIGVPEMLESIQRGMNTSLNQVIDNATVANIRGFAVRRASSAAKSLDNYYPGKKILFDQADDIKDFQLGEVYPSGFEVPRMLKELAERRVGIGDPNLGREVPGNMQGTATTTLALLQESARRFDLYAKDIRRALGEVGMQYVERIQQFKPVERMYSVMGQDGELVERTLTLPESINVREHLKVSTTSSSSQSNKEVSRQAAIQAFSIVRQYMQEILGLAQLMENAEVPPNMKELTYKMGELGERLMIRILEGFDMPEVAAFLPQLEGVLSEGQQRTAAMAPGAGQGDAGVAGTGPVGGPGPQPGGPPGATAAEGRGDLRGTSGFGPQGKP